MIGPRRGRRPVVLLLAILVPVAATAAAMSGSGTQGRFLAASARVESTHPRVGSPLWTRWSGRAGLHERAAAGRPPAGPAPGLTPRRPTPPGGGPEDASRHPPPATTEHAPAAAV